MVQEARQVNKTQSAPLREWTKCKSEATRTNDLRGAGGNEGLVFLQALQKSGPKVSQRPRGPMIREGRVGMRSLFPADPSKRVDQMQVRDHEDQ